MVMSNSGTGALDLILSKEQVYLAIDLPELSLFRGDVGVVRSAWLYPQRAYEVEFMPALGQAGARLLLLYEQVERLDVAEPTPVVAPTQFQCPKAGVKAGEPKREAVSSGHRSRSQ